MEPALCWAVKKKNMHQLGKSLLFKKFNTKWGDIIWPLGDTLEKPCDKGSIPNSIPVLQMTH